MRRRGCGHGHQHFFASPSSPRHKSVYARSVAEGLEGVHQKMHAERQVVQQNKQSAILTVVRLVTTLSWRGSGYNGCSWHRSLVAVNGQPNNNHYVTHAAPPPPCSLECCTRAQPATVVEFARSAVASDAQWASSARTRVHVQHMPFACMYCVQGSSCFRMCIHTTTT